MCVRSISDVFSKAYLRFQIFHFSKILKYNGNYLLEEWHAHSYRNIYSEISVNVSSKCLDMINEKFLSELLIDKKTDQAWVDLLKTPECRGSGGK